MDKKIFLIRHGEVEEKFINCYNGHNNIDISENGKVQTRNAATKLGKLDTLISSDLKRCRDYTDYFTYNKLVVTSHIREKSWGAYEGLSFEEIKKTGVEYINFTQFITDIGGENFEDFTDRVITFWRMIKEIDHKNMGLFTHGGVIRVILAYENSISFEETFEKYSISYGEVITINS